jgi:O-antigen/teichoic acid export membrane protein
MVLGLSLQSVATVYQGTIAAAVSFLLARTLGPESFGLYIYCVTVASVIATIQDGGFRTLLVRERTAPSASFLIEKKTLLSYALGHLTLVATFSALAVIILPIEHKKTLLAAILCFSLFGVAQTTSAVLRGDGRLEFDAWWQIIFRTATAIGAFLGMTMSQVSPLIIFLLMAASSTLPLFVLGPSLLAAPSTPKYKSILREILPLAVIGFSSMIYFKIDIIMLYYMIDDTKEVGYYAAAFKFIEGGILLMSPISIVVFRTLRQKWNNRLVFSMTLRRIFLFSCCGAVVSSLMLQLLGSNLMILAYGSSYEEAIDVLFLLSFALLFMIPNYILTQAAIACDQSRSYAWITFTVAILNVTLNLFLIPLHGKNGAVLATIAAEALMLLMLAFVLRAYIFSSSTDRLN